MGSSRYSGQQLQPTRICQIYSLHFRLYICINNKVENAIKKLGIGLSAGHRTLDT